MCQIFFQFDWQTGDNIIFNNHRPYSNPGTQLGPRTRISCLLGAEAEVLVSSAFCVFQYGFEAIWACLEIRLNLCYKEYYTLGAPVYTYFVSLGPFPFFLTYFDASPREYSTNIWV